MPDEHARLQPSAAYRWINCPGSIELSEQAPKDTGTIYSTEGTYAHHLAEAHLRRLIGEIGPEDLEETIRSIQPDAEMTEGVEYYKGFVQTELQTAGPTAVLLPEQKLLLSEWIPGGFGTSDAVIVSDDILEVIDFKYGKGVRVDAEGNPQLRLYGLGAQAKFIGMYGFEYVRMTIVQPRLDHISTEELPLEQLTAWADEVIRPAVHEIITRSGRMKSGDWCRFCPARAICRTRAEANLELARLDFKPAPTLSDEEIGEVLSKADALEKWVKDVRDYAYAGALKGKKYSGWKLVEGRSTRKITDERAAISRLEEAGFIPEVIYKPRELQTLTVLERSVGKRRFAEMMGSIIERSAGKPTLVPESDKRKEINTVKEDFES